MEARYIITIKYYEEKTKEEKVVDWYNMGKYISYRLTNGTIKNKKWDRVVNIKLIEEEGK